MYSITLSSRRDNEAPPGANCPGGKQTSEQMLSMQSVTGKTEAGASCGGDGDGLNPAGDTWGGGDTVGGFSEDAST